VCRSGLMMLRKFDMAMLSYRCGPCSACLTYQTGASTLNVTLSLAVAWTSSGTDAILKLRRLPLQTALPCSMLLVSSASSSSRRV